MCAELQFCVAQDGELPTEMVPDHNDEFLLEDDGDDDDTDDDANLTAGVGGSLAHVRLPIRLTAQLVLLQPGRIEFLHPNFHSEKQLWPVGYRAKRKTQTPASGHQEVWHVMEVLEAPDGSGPLFR